MIKKIVEVKSIEDGFLLNTHFVVRGLNLPCDIERCKKMAAEKDIKLFGYGAGATKTILSSKALSDFENGALEINIVDAPFPVLTDSELPEVLLKAVIRSAMKVCMTLTKKGSYTALHIDPPSGGGWMYLQCGCKKWQIANPEDVEIFLDNGKTLDDDLKDPPQDSREYLYETVIGAGDFIYFPPGAPHRVWTYENSFGISGYALV